MLGGNKYYQTTGHFIAACVILALLDVIAVGLRFWTRRKHRQPLKVDDWLILPATVSILDRIHCGRFNPFLQFRLSPLGYVLP
jgi:hypothetical protein